MLCEPKGTGLRSKQNSWSKVRRLGQPTGMLSKAVREDQNWKLRQKRAGKFNMAKNNQAKCTIWATGVLISCVRAGVESGEAERS